MSLQPSETAEVRAGAEAEAEQQHPSALEKKVGGLSSCRWLIALGGLLLIQSGGFCTAKFFPLSRFAILPFVTFYVVGGPAAVGARVVFG